MNHYIGLDISIEHTAVCVVDETGKVRLEKVVASNPDAIARWLGHFPGIACIGLEGRADGSLASRWACRQGLADFLH